jgi:2-iminobutanoate/2-iminopropanoate deaminase
MKKLSVLFALLFVFTCAYSQQKHDVKAVTSNDAPKAIGPYSQAVTTGRMIYTSGQIGLSPVTNAFAGDDITAQTQQALKNLKAIVEAAGTDMAHVVKVTIFMKDLNDFAKVNDIYKDYFPGTPPARSTVQVARLPKDALIEIECIATEK